MCHCSLLVGTVDLCWYSAYGHGASCRPQTRRRAVSAVNGWLLLLLLVHITSSVRGTRCGLLLQMSPWHGLCADHTCKACMPCKTAEPHDTVSGVHCEAEKRNQLSFICVFFSACDRNLWIFFTYIRPKESRSVSYYFVYLILAYVENFAASVTFKRFVLTSQVMKLMITS